MNSVGPSHVLYKRGLDANIKKKLVAAGRVGMEKKKIKALKLGRIFREQEPRPINPAQL